MNHIYISIERLKQIPIQDIRITRNDEPSDDKFMPFVVAHNSCNTNIFDIACSNLTKIAQCDKLKNLINRETTLSSTRQLRNFRLFLHMQSLTFNAVDILFLSVNVMTILGAEHDYIYTGSELITTDRIKIYTYQKMTCRV